MHLRDEYVQGDRVALQLSLKLANIVFGIQAPLNLTVTVLHFLEELPGLREESYFSILLKNSTIVCSALAATNFKAAFCSSLAMSRLSRLFKDVFKLSSSRMTPRYSAAEPVLSWSALITVTTVSMNVMKSPTETPNGTGMAIWFESD